MDNQKKLRRAARCIKYLLETEGKTLETTNIMGIISDRNLDDISSLKEVVESNLNKRKPISSKKQQLERFMIENWLVIKDNEPVKSVLTDAFCRGRYTKEQRQEMIDSLYNRCNIET